MKNSKRPTPQTKPKKDNSVPATKAPPAIEKIPDARQLKDLTSVSRATLKDFELLGITTVDELARQEPKELYRKLCKLSKDRHDLCTEDVFSAVIAQAKNPKLAAEKCDWWYWNRRRQRAPAKPRPTLARRNSGAGIDSEPSEEAAEVGD
jgi:predicted flap endonuclease-1-like 5' DNA nuclease